MKVYEFLVKSIQNNAEIEVQRMRYGCAFGFIEMDLMIFFENCWAQSAFA